MPASKVRPADVAAEAKKTYIPYIRKKLESQWPAHSWLVQDSSVMRCPTPPQQLRCRMKAVVEGDPVDVALELAIAIEKKERVVLVNMANEKRPGGDWESGVMAPEECLCRRSNLFATLATPSKINNPSPSNYPIPATGGIYSPFVVVFRSGPERYQLWQKFKALPIISVPPVRRPKVDPSGKKYSFEQEKDLMREKIRTILRMAVYWGYSDICAGSFGIGPIFRNPTREVATMWRDLLYFDDEFKGHFSNVVFAFDNLDGTGPSGSNSGSAASSSKSGSNKAALLADMEIFRDVFDPAKMFPR